MNVLKEEGQSSINQISWSNTSYHTDGKIYELERIWEKKVKITTTNCTKDKIYQILQKQ